VEPVFFRAPGILGRGNAFSEIFFAQIPNQQTKSKSTSSDYLFLFSRAKPSQADEVELTSSDPASSAPSPPDPGSSGPGPVRPEFV